MNPNFQIILSKKSFNFIILGMEGLGSKKMKICKSVLRFKWIVVCKCKSHSLSYDLCLKIEKKALISTAPHKSSASWREESAEEVTRNGVVICLYYANHAWNDGGWAHGDINYLVWMSSEL